MAATMIRPDSSEFERIEDTIGKPWHKQPPVITVENRRDLRKSSQKSKCGIQMPQEHRATTLLIILVMIIRLLNVDFRR
jgi:hypothetical protein